MFRRGDSGRVLGRLHYALEPGGLLFLGKAELLLSHARILTPVEGMRCFFRRASRDAFREGAALLGIRPGERSTDISADDVRMRQEAMMSSPAGQVVVDATGRLVMSNHRANTLFGLGARQVGQPFGDLDLSVRPVELRPLLDQVLHERRTIWVREVEWSRPGPETMWFDVRSCLWPETSVARRA